VAETLALPLASVEQALALVQTLDPTGVGARSLGECLALQAREADRYDPLMARLLDNLDLLGRGELARLRRLCGVDDEDFADMLAELRGYDPKPGLRFGGGPAEASRPISSSAQRRAGRRRRLAIALNQATLPRVLVNRSYYVEMRRACVGKAARAWLGEAGRCQLAGQGAGPAAENHSQSGGADRQAAGRLLSPRRLALAPADPAHRGRGGRDARKHDQPRHLQQVSPLPARHVRAEVLLHLGRCRPMAKGFRPKR
jgi:hypothetical protein